MRRAADAASVHTQINMEDVPKVLNIGMFEHLETSTKTQMA